MHLHMEDENLDKQIDFCVALLSNIDQCYDAADIETKQQIIGSIFPEKLIFEKINIKPLKLMMALLCLNGKGLEEKKNGQHPIFSMLSVGVQSKNPGQRRIIKRFTDDFFTISV